jgi:hypothetical protein
MVSTGMRESKQPPANEPKRYSGFAIRPESRPACDKSNATFAPKMAESIPESHSVQIPQPTQIQSESFCPEQAEVDAYLYRLEYELKENTTFRQRQTSKESKQIATKTGSASFPAVLVYVLVLTICGLGYLIYLLYQAISM